MNRCSALTIKSIDIGVSLKEWRDALMVAVQGCMSKRGEAFKITGIDIGVSIKEELDALLVAKR